MKNKTLNFAVSLLVLVPTALSAQNNVYVDVSVPPLNPASKAGWNLVFQDEFNGSKNSTWNNNDAYTGYCWGNAHPNSPFYNKISNQSFTATTIKFTSKKENYTPPGYYVSKPYTSALVNSDHCLGVTTPVNNSLFKYGYFEVRVKNPKAQKMWPAFWLFGEPNGTSTWNEIDVFEMGTGDEVVMSNHYTPPSGTHQAHFKWLFSYPGQTFGNTWVTYAMKWEPNKIVWYINNVPVRIETNLNGIIPDVAMRLKLNSGLDENWTSFSLYLQELFPNDMEVDYVRVYQRASHPTQSNPTAVPTPDPIFTINKATGFLPASPVVATTSRVIMDASQSYMPNHYYCVYVQLSDALGNLYGTDYGRWLTTAEINDIHKFDVKAFAASLGLTMTAGNIYRVKLAGSPWTEVSQYVQLTPCSNNVSFKINAQGHTTFPAPINIPYNNGKPRVILDATPSTSCDNNYFISVIQCNASGVPSGTEIMKWMTSADKDYLAYFDVESFCQQNSFPLTYGNYYRVKIAFGSPWLERVQVIYISPCTTTISFTINGQGNVFPAPININNGERIVLDGAASLMCNNNYFISVQECTSGGAAFGTEIYEWRNHAAYDSWYGAYFYSIGEVNIRDFCAGKNFTLGCNKYYRVKLAGGSPWTEEVKMIYITPCPNVNNTYMINGLDQPTYNYGDPATVWPPLSLAAPNSISCDNHYFLSVQKRVSGVLVGTEAMAWLNELQIYELKVTGSLDLATFASDPNRDGNTSDGIVFTNNTTYRVKLVASAGTCNSNVWVENNKIIYFGTGSGKLAEDDSASVENQDADISVYPNPTSGAFLLELPKDISNAEVNVISVTGSRVRSFISTERIQLFSLNDLPDGIYFIQCITSEGTFTKKLQVMK